MKTFILAAIAMMSMPAMAVELDQLVCKSRPSNYVFKNFTLTARHLVTGTDSASMWDVKAVVDNGNDTFKSRVETGRIDHMSSDKGYNPRKYVGHVRMDLSKLTDTQDFGRFLPSDTCVIYVMMPLKAKTKFEAPVTVNCDQGGGKMVLDCSAVKSK